MFGPKFDPPKTMFNWTSLHQHIYINNQGLDSLYDAQETPYIEKRNAISQTIKRNYVRDENITLMCGVTPFQFVYRM